MTKFNGWTDEDTWNAYIMLINNILFYDDCVEILDLNDFTSYCKKVLCIHENDGNSINFEEIYEHLKESKRG